METQVLQHRWVQCKWMAGNVYATTGLKGAGDFIGKMFKGALRGRLRIKPEYKGEGYLMLEPTYKYMLLEDVADWKADWYWTMVCF